MSVTSLRFSLGWAPSVDVMPETLNGVRALAEAALTVQDVRTIDKLELLAVQLLKIEPQVQRDTDEQHELTGLRHSEYGLVLQWRLHTSDECLACEGDGDFLARAKDGRYYTVSCPACGGEGEAQDGEERYVETDIDGLPLQEAA